MSTDKDKTYNGWTNYETWAVALWLDNEQGSYNYWRERSQEAYNDAEKGEYDWQTKDAMAELALAAALKDWHEERAEELGFLDGDKAGVFADLIGAALSEVDWHEIASHYLDEVEKGEASDTEGEPSTTT
jgi:hypothetical protein